MMVFQVLNVLHNEVDRVGVSLSAHPGRTSPPRTAGWPILHAPVGLALRGSISSNSSTSSIGVFNRLISFTDDASAPRTNWYRLVHTGTASYKLVQTGTYWYRLAHTGIDWHTLVLNGADWYSLVQTCTDWYSLVQTGIDWYRLVQTYWYSLSQQQCVQQ